MTGLLDALPLFSYDVAVIDPPWKYELYSDKGKAKSPEAHYGCMSMDEIAALRVGDLLAPAGVLVCWCTGPLIEAQYRVIRKWGLEPVTLGVWAKRTINGKFRWGTGYVLRSVCEPFVIAKLPGVKLNGSRITNMVETMEDAAIDGLAREHSRKPDEFYSMIEALAPGTRRVDIFARRHRAGWDCVGNELEKFEAESGAAHG